ncbi:L-fucose/L-arabinose isomerase family protein [Nocardiopsis coralliicola]
MTDSTARRPRIGLLGVMQPLYDAMLPGITERQHAYALEVADQLAGVCDVTVAPPVRDRGAAEQAVRGFEDAGLDGVLVVMLTYGPSLRLTRLFADLRLPVCLANIQPEPAPTAQWDMADMTYNQGVHGAQDTANALVRTGRPFTVVTEDRAAPAFAERIGRWARAARAAADLRQLRIGVVGYPMNGMGDARFDESELLRALGPEVVHIAQGELFREMQAVGADETAELIAEDRARFAVDERLSDAELGDHARYRAALARVLERHGCRAYSTHFDALGEDGRFDRLPMAAASTLMAEGYGFAGEGDAVAAAAVYAGHRLTGAGHFTEMYAMDFPRDAVLMSHMGEGNWHFARDDEPVRLIKRPLEIGGLGDPPTLLFRLRPGPATLASLVTLGGGRFRLVAAEGEVPDTPALPALEMPYGYFQPDTGVRACLDGWLQAGGTHHMAMVPGRCAADWAALCTATGAEFRQV